MNEFEPEKKPSVKWWYVRHYLILFVMAGTAAFFIKEVTPSIIICFLIGVGWSLVHQPTE